MKNYHKAVEIRWSDLDANFHVRHSVYYDWGAFLRMSFLWEHGLTASVMQEHKVGPIIFREEALFKKELHFGDKITVALYLQKCSTDFSKWTMIHEIWKNENTLSAIITVDGAWINTELRKLTIPEMAITQLFNFIPKTENFEWIEKKLK